MGEMTRDQVLQKIRKNEKLERADLRGIDLSRATLNMGGCIQFSHIPKSIGERKWDLRNRVSPIYGGLRKAWINRTGGGIAWAPTVQSI